MKQTDNFRLRRIADETILVPCGQMAEQMDRVITLSDTAEYIYEYAPRAESLDKFVRMMGKEYHMEDLQQLQQDVQEVLDFMIDRQIMQYSDPLSGW